MKIEMCENLFYSFLRHVKECQIVQTNWKVSKQWTLRHEEEISNLYQIIDDHFSAKYQYKVFKQNSSYRQFIFQGEADAVGLSFENGEKTVFAVDVAFHEFGLNYGSRAETVRRIIAKCARTALCLYGYMDTISGEIIFASPKIGGSILDDLIPCIEDLNLILHKHNLDFKVRVIANEDFNSSVLQPILLMSDGIADTSELFIRGYQMYNMFAPAASRSHTRTVAAERPENINSDVYKELKIGQLAQRVLRTMLEADTATVEEIELMQTAEYSKSTFDLGYPLLVSISSDFDPVRYYSQPLYISGKEYKMCSQWFEVPSNNDRPHLLKWIEDHQKTLEKESMLFRKKKEAPKIAEDYQAVKKVEQDVYEKYKELKVGQIAQQVLRPMLEAGYASEDEVRHMQTKEYSKSTFDIQYPLLVAADSDINSARYYANPLWIRGKKYHMCNDWYEKAHNDDRSYLLSWIDKRQKG